MTPVIFTRPSRSVLNSIGVGDSGADPSTPWTYTDSFAIGLPSRRTSRAVTVAVGLRVTVHGPGSPFAGPYAPPSPVAGWYPTSGSGRSGFDSQTDWTFSGSGFGGPPRTSRRSRVRT